MSASVFLSSDVGRHAWSKVPTPVYGIRLSAISARFHSCFAAELLISQPIRYSA
jgi:hypothetical protein